MVVDEIYAMTRTAALIVQPPHSLASLPYRQKDIRVSKSAWKTLVGLETMDGVVLVRNQWARFIGQSLSLAA